MGSDFFVFLTGSFTFGCLGLEGGGCFFRGLQIPCSLWVLVLATVIGEGCCGHRRSHHQDSMEMETMIEQDATVPVVMTVLEVDVLEMTVLSSEEMVAVGDLRGAMMPPCQG